MKQQAMKCKQAGYEGRPVAPHTSALRVVSVHAPEQNKNNNNNKARSQNSLFHVRKENQQDATI